MSSEVLTGVKFRSPVFCNVTLYCQMGSPRSFQGMGCSKTSRTIHPMMQQHHIPDNQNIQTQNKSKTFNHDLPG